VAAALLGATVLLWWQTRPAAQGVKPAPASRQETPKGPPQSTAAPTVPAVPAKAADDPRDALEAALKSPDPGQRARDFGELLQRWLERDSAAAMDYVRQMPRGREHSQALMQALNTIGQRDPVRALTLARELVVTREERFFYSAMFDRLARENPSLAIERLALVPAGEARENAVRALMDVWVRADGAAAKAWAQGLPEPADRNVAVESVINELAPRDPRGAVDLAKKSLTGPALTRTLSRAVQILTATDPDGAASLVGLLPPGDVQTMAAVQIARAFADRNIDLALEWVKSLSIDLTRWTAFNSVLSVWAQKDPSAAARYVLEMPPGQPLDFAARHLAMILAANPREAVMWADALPSESAKESARPMIASTWAQRAPAEAVNWAASLRERPPYTDTITAAYSYWMLQDANAARAWLEKADVPAETKAQLLSR
jgi:hypothetical protein